VAEQLIDKGADINALNADGESPLFYAARKSMPALVRLLLQRNARPDIRDKYGETARDHAPDIRTSDCFTVHGRPVNSSALSSGDSTIGNSVGHESGMSLSFPHELLLKVIFFLDPKSVSRAACVSGKWHRGIPYFTTLSIVSFVWFISIFRFDFSFSYISM
jgi:hypothetical protein